jgi:hypothetical protein
LKDIEAALQIEKGQLALPQNKQALKQYSQKLDQTLKEKRTAASNDLFETSM